MKNYIEPIIEITNFDDIVATATEGPSAVYDFEDTGWGIE